MATTNFGNFVGANNYINSFPPRDYQSDLVEMALKNNSIIYLPTGTGKSFIAVMVLRKLARPLAKPLSEGGKISVVLANTHALVNQHSEYLQRLTAFKVLVSHGKNNGKSWKPTQWKDHLDKHQVLVVTPAIFLKILQDGTLSLNNVNLLIFDECHRAVNNHPMKQVMVHFKELKEPPRILGLTATLLNGNYAPRKIIDELKTLEATLHSRIVTVELQQIIGFYANPREILVKFAENEPLAALSDAMEHFQDLVQTIALIGQKEKVKNTINLIQNIIVHIKMFGVFGGRIALVIYIKQFQSNRRSRFNDQMCPILDATITTLFVIRKIFEDEMKKQPKNNWFETFSSQRVHVLLNIIKEYINNSQEICAIIFVKRRFTAVILYHILSYLTLTDSTFKCIRPDFVLGSVGISYNRVSLSSPNKANKIKEFYNKKTNFLVASSVLEEGIDVPSCNLVINFDAPVDYRAYIQSKGRARNKSAIYYLMVNTDVHKEFTEAYEEYQSVEKIVNEYLSNRSENEFENVHMTENGYQQPTELTRPTKTDSIALLHQYCSEKYTPSLINCTLQTNGNNSRNITKLPTATEIREQNKVPYEENGEFAEISEAMDACKLLSQVGEPEDNFLPKRNNVAENKKYEFRTKKIPDVCSKQVEPNKTVYLHSMEMTPKFSFSQSVIDKIYSQPFSYGILTAQELPQLCEFPIYVLAGEITVNFKVNQRSFDLTVSELDSIKNFHFVVFNDVLSLVKSYLVFNNDKEADVLLVVPMNTTHDGIDFDVLNKNQALESIRATNEDIMELKNTFLNKTVIVENSNSKYLVAGIASNASMLEELEKPSNNKETKSAGAEKMLLGITIPEQVNYLKPLTDKGNSQTVLKYLSPKLCLIQSFPSVLWIHAFLLPSVLYRIISLLQTEELRKRIATETTLGKIHLKESEKWLPMVLDEHLSHSAIEEIASANEPVQSPMSDQKMCNLKLLQGDISKPQEIGQTVETFFANLESCADFVVQEIRIIEEMEESKRANTPTIGFANPFVKNDIGLLKNRKNDKGPELVEVFRALTTLKSYDIMNLERLEILGDSFLKFSISGFIYLKYPEYNEGKASILRGDLISNNNLYSIGVAKQLDRYLKTFNCTSFLEWKPPCFHVPKDLTDRLSNKQLSLSSIGSFQFSKKEQLSGILEPTTVEQLEKRNKNGAKTKSAYLSILNSLEIQSVPNRTIADSIEALIAVYFQSGGFTAGLKLLEWLQIVPECENIEQLYNTQLIDTEINGNGNDIDFYIPKWWMLEEQLGYRFKNPNYLLQALTHPSYISNCLTNSYQKLEFLGDALLDFLITCHIYENCGNLSPGQLTDLRSALVNNITFASFAVRHGFHKFILFSNAQLLQNVNNFVSIQEQRNFEIVDDILILSEEEDMYVAQQTDVPKILGDVFESLAAAVYIDSGLNLEKVWDVFYRIMWEEIESFYLKVPKNPVRLLNEATVAHPKYRAPVVLEDGGTMIGLDFTLSNVRRTVYGFGENRFFAKKAAAKMALHLLQK